jgi:hypothetical protein
MFRFSIRELMPKRRWFQFSLGTALLVMTLTGVSLGWSNNYRFCKQKAADHHTEACWLWLGGHFVTTGSESEESLKQRSKISESCSHRREYHEQLKSAYEAAAWRPWERLWIDDKPPVEVP